MRDSSLVAFSKNKEEANTSAQFQNLVCHFSQTGAVSQARMQRSDILGFDFGFFRFGRETRIIQISTTSIRQNEANRN